jgi:alkanesulfonate monooxygenase SsuD/methylene tetrahydromethanopterin reductase-like flavin-dependent oxidoreductase (luciferase family)
MDSVWTEAEKAGVNQMLEYAFLGSPETVERALQLFLDKTGVDELMVASHLYSLEARLRSLELLATMFGRNKE